MKLPFVLKSIITVCISLITATWVLANFQTTNAAACYDVKLRFEAENSIYTPLIQTEYSDNRIHVMADVIKSCSDNIAGALNAMLIAIDDSQTAPLDYSLNRLASSFNISGKKYSVPPGERGKNWIRMVADSAGGINQSGSYRLFTFVVNPNYHNNSDTHTEEFGILAFDMDPMIINGTPWAGAGNIHLDADDTYFVSANNPPSLINLTQNNIPLGATEDALTNNIPTDPTFNFSVIDLTDTVSDTYLRLEKKQGDSFVSTSFSGGLNNNAVGIQNISLGGLEYSTIYKATAYSEDDQRGYGETIGYFSTQPDTTPPANIDVARAYKMKDIESMQAMDEYIAEIEFLTTTDNAGIGGYALFSAEYLECKSLFNSNHGFHTEGLKLDSQGNATIEIIDYNATDSFGRPDAFFTALTTLVQQGQALSYITSNEALTDNRIFVSGTSFYQADGDGCTRGFGAINARSFIFAGNKIVLLAHDTSTGIDGTPTWNFSVPKVVFKPGDVEGSFKTNDEVINGTIVSVEYPHPDGIVTNFDAIQLFRHNAINAHQYPIFVPRLLDNNLE